MAKVIGIDLGTTYSAVSVWDEKRKMPIIIHNLQGSYTTPSVVSLNEAREIIVGEPAKQNLWMDPTNTVSEIKREMGTDFKVTMGGEPYNPQMISAFILRYLKQCAEKYLGEPVHDAVITVPAYFEEPQRVATSDAASIAGLNVGRLLNEPTAAALAYGVAKSSSEEGSADADSDEVYAVYDLGGGTFDVSIIRISSQDVTVVGTGGDSRLGGLDMDEAVANWAIRRIKEEQGIDLSGDQAVKRRLKVESEGIKKVLVASENAILNVPFLTVVDGKPLSVKLNISRAQFDQLIKGLLKKSKVCLEGAMASAKEKNMVDWEDLNGILLVGGPTRLQCIHDLLKDTLREHCPDKEPVVKCDLNPDEVVAMGAAILAAGLLAIGKPPEVVETMTPKQIQQAQKESEDVAATAAAPTVDIFDVTGHSLGIAIEGTKFQRFIAKDTPIPITQSQQGFGNASDYATELLCQVYQGEDDYVAANKLVGEVRITGLDPLPAGQQHFEITFSLDMSGQLSTTCTDLRTKKQYTGAFKFDDVKRISGDEIRKSRERLARMSGGGNGSGPEAVVPTSPTAATAAATAAAPAPLSPTADMPAPLSPTADIPGVPTLSPEQIPAGNRAYWDEAREFLSKVDGAKKAALLRAINAFATAVQSGDAAQIEQQGLNLEDAVNLVKA